MIHSPGATTINIAIDLHDPLRAPAFRTALGLESKGSREYKQFKIDKRMREILDQNVGTYQQSDVINQGINLIAIMNGWI